MWNKLPISNDSKARGTHWWLVFLTCQSSLVRLAIGLASYFCWISCSGTLCAQDSSEQGSVAQQTEAEPLQTESLAKPAVQAIATQILHRSLLESVWGKPTVCDVRQSIRMFGKTRSSFGKFVRAGQGSGRLRLSMQIPAGQQMNSLMQVSDGELLSTTVLVGQQSMRTQVDLGKVRERLPLTAGSLQDPVVAMYLAIGGQAELLRNICQQYIWTQVTEGQLGQQKVWWLTGQLNDKPAPYHASALIDQRAFETQSSLKPNRATLAIGHTDSPMPFWLYQAEQWNAKAAEDGTEFHVLTQWDTPVVLTADRLVADMFRLDTSDNQPFQEETKLYMPPIPKEMAMPISSNPPLR